MTAFFDTSALVKLYVPEVGHDLIGSLEEPTISEFTRVELPSALWRKCRIGELAADRAARLTGQFEADYYGTDRSPRFTVLRLSDLALQRAASLVVHADLRAGDAIQLASALVAREVGREVTSFAAFDSRLRSAAALEGFTLVPRLLPPLMRLS